MDVTQSGQREVIIRLIGGQRVIAYDGAQNDMFQFYGILFGRLIKEVKNTGYPIGNFQGTGCPINYF